MIVSKYLFLVMGERMQINCMGACTPQNTGPLETNPRFQQGMISILGEPNNGI
jgi:hypothetical protein